MTREEAIARVDSVKDEGLLGGSYIVDILVALGLLHLDVTKDKDRIAAATCLTRKFTTVLSSDGTSVAQLSQDGAYEILNILTKSGFKITRET